MTTSKLLAALLLMGCGLLSSGVVSAISGEPVSSGCSDKIDTHSSNEIFRLKSCWTHASPSWINAHPRFTIGSGATRWMREPYSLLKIGAKISPPVEPGNYSWDQYALKAELMEDNKVVRFDKNTPGVTTEIYEVLLFNSDKDLWVRSSFSNFKAKDMNKRWKLVSSISFVPMK